MPKTDKSRTYNLYSNYSPEDIAGMYQWHDEATSLKESTPDDVRLNTVLLRDNSDRIVEIANRLSVGDGNNKIWTFDEVIADEAMLKRVLIAEPSLSNDAFKKALSLKEFYTLHDDPQKYDTWVLDALHAAPVTSRYLDLGTSLFKFAWENNPLVDYSTPFPSIPWGHFNNYRLGLTDEQDRQLRAIEAANGHFNNFADWFNLLNHTPEKIQQHLDELQSDQIRSNGQSGYLVSIAEYILHPTHKISITSGMISNQRNEPFWRYSNLFYAGNEIMLSGLSLEQAKEMTQFECTPGQDAYYDSLGLDCATEQADQSNLNDLTIENAPWNDDSHEGKLRDLESVEALGYTAYHANQGLSWARYYQGLNLWAKNTELDGDPTWWTLTTFVPITAEVITTQAITKNQLSGWEYGARYALGGVAIGFNAITETPQVDNALANNGVFAMMGWTYPKIMSYANTPYDFLKFGNNDYDNKTSMHEFLLPPLATGFYMYGHAWAGWNAGVALKAGQANPWEKWGPLAQAGLGVSAQFISNAIEGDPRFTKYGLAGTGAMVLTGAAGYLLGDSPVVENAMRLNPMIQAGPDGFYASVELGHLFTRASEMRRDTKAKSAYE